MSARSVVEELVSYVELKQPSLADQEKMVSTHNTPENLNVQEEPPDMTLGTAHKTDALSVIGVNPGCMTRICFGSEPDQSAVANGIKEAISHPSESFNTNAGLGLHEQVQPLVKPYACSRCEKRFRKRTDFSRHYRTHTGEKPYECSECGKCFSLQSILSKHRKTHTGEKPFTCPECGKCFASKPNLVRHKMIHTGGKSFACAECGECFNRKTEFRNHMLTHTD